MNKKANAWVIGIIVGLIVALLTGGSILGFSLTGNAKAIRNVDSNKNFCPSTLYFQDNKESFKVTLTNGGKKGDLIVYLSSKEVLSKDETEEIFLNKSQIMWWVQENERQDFNFEIKRLIEDEDKFEIKIDYGCQGLFCGVKTTYCEYEIKDNSDYIYELKKEKV